MVSLKLAGGARLIPPEFKRFVQEAGPKRWLRSTDLFGVSVSKDKTLEPHNKNGYHGVNKRCHETIKFNARSIRVPVQFKSTATLVTAQPIDAICYLSTGST